MDLLQLALTKCRQHMRPQQLIVTLDCPCACRSFISTRCTGLNPLLRPACQRRLIGGDMLPGISRTEQGAQFLLGVCWNQLPPKQASSIRHSEKTEYHRTETDDGTRHSRF